jgi:hypothetical protein
LFACAIRNSQNPALLYSDDPTWRLDSQDAASAISSTNAALLVLGKTKEDDL